MFGTVGMTLVAVALTFFFGITSALENTRAVGFDRAVLVMDGMVKDIDAQLEPVAHQAKWIADQVASGQLDIDNTAQWDSVVKVIPASSPQILSVALLRLDRSVRGYNVKADTVLEDVTPDQNIVKQVLKAAQTVSGVQWFPPLWLAPIQTLSLNAWIPLKRDGKLIGVYVTGVAVGDISKTIVQRTRREFLTPFILFDTSWVLTHPKIGSWRPKTAEFGAGNSFGIARGSVPLPTLEELDDPYIEKIWDAEVLETERFSPLSNTQARWFDFADGPRIFMTRTIARYGDRPWTLGAYFGIELFEAEQERLIIFGIVGGIILIISIIVGLLTTRWSAMPIRRLAVAAEQIRAGDYQTMPLLPANSIRELDDASSSFNDMVEGLKEKEVMRGLFGKIMPEAVAQQLLEDKGQLAPHAAEATVFFVDLAGFTAMSEALEPGAIIDVLNDFFSTAVEIIERHGGVVTQFQGDAILAIFNVPLPDPDHAAKAVRAGIELRTAVSTKEFHGQTLSCRIGINTGEVVAANVGAPDRMNYTVHGDAVNLAARLEALNKEYDTKLMISASTAAYLDDYPLRELGEVEVRGKSETVSIYTIDPD